MAYDDWKAREPDSADPGRLRTQEDRDDDRPDTCDTCGEPLIDGWRSIQGVGIFCSVRCGNTAVLKHQQHMQRLVKEPVTP